VCLDKYENGCRHYAVSMAGRRRDCQPLIDRRLPGAPAYGSRCVTMPSMDATYRLVLLGPAIAAARKALAELESDDVPARLRRVVASSGRVLPPPLAKGLVGYLDEEAWLRDQALEELENDGSPGHTASRLFLERPDGWLEDLDELEMRADEHAAHLRVEELERALARSEAELAAARAKAKRAAETADAAAGKAAEAAERARVQVRAARAESAGDIERLRRELSAAQNDVATGTDQLAGEQALVGRLRSDVQRLRAARGAAGSSARLGAGGWRDVVDMARSIDTMVTALRPDPHLIAPEPGARVPLKLPAGVSPDGRASIEWLLAWTGAFTMVVDGYNAAFHRAGEAYATADARAALVVRLGHLRKAASGTIRVIVVFDSEHGDGDPGVPGPVEVRWDVDADEAVRQLARTVDGDVVVVSSDREVQQGAERAGALVIWSEALASWRG